MTNDRYTPAQIAEGKAALEQALVAARLLNQAGQPLSPQTLAAFAVQPHLRASNLDALVIRQVPGGWVADILLKKVPKGVADVIGTPEAAPLTSRAAAWA